jgi:hypothetical protein
MRRELSVPLGFVVGLSFLVLLSSGCREKPSDPVTFLSSYQIELANITKRDMGHCKNAISAILSCQRQNKTDLDKVKSKLQQNEATLPEKEKKALQKQREERMKETLRESMRVLMEFSRQCPEQATVLGQAIENGIF